MTRPSRSSVPPAPRPDPPASGETKSSPGKGRKRASTVRVTLPDGSTRQVKRGTPLRTVLEQAKISAPAPIVAARFRHRVTSLDRKVDKPGPLDVVHIGTRDGALVYRRSLSFILIRAVAELFPGQRVYINHSLDRGYYSELYPGNGRPRDATPLTETDVARIEERMREIIARDEPIAREIKPLDEAIELFREAGMNDKVELLRWDARNDVPVYRSGNCINHFYGHLAPSTGCLSVFELKLEYPGLILRFPLDSQPGKIPPSMPHEKMLGILREYERWMRILNWRTVPQLNELVQSERVREYILIAEALHEKRLAQIADAITEHPRRPRVVLLSGPSSSGKTTSTKRLAIQLRVNGHRATVIELDNFFVDRERTPKDERGEYDFEHLHAIDIPLLQDCVRRLLEGEVVSVPKFNFQEGRSVPGETHQLEEGEILILEGIHALNTGLLPEIPDGLKFKIYASPMTHLNIDDHNRISSSDARLLRRIVRDFSYRGYDAVDTIRRWPSVRRGEARNIFPYQEQADVIFNSALPYEIAALKPHALSVLQRVKPTQEEYSEASRLIRFLGYFRPIKGDYVPRHSLLREFIGGSCFTY